jgi:hypothetical protein
VIVATIIQPKLIIPAGGPALPDPAVLRRQKLAQIAWHAYELRKKLVRRIFERGKRATSR